MLETFFASPTALTKKKKANARTRALFSIPAKAARTRILKIRNASTTTAGIAKIRVSNATARNNRGTKTDVVHHFLGWVAVTRSFKNVVSPKDSKTYTPECGEDKDPDFRCKDSSKTYIHKTRVSDGDKKTIKKSCRSTLDRLKDMKNKYNERVEKAKEQRKKTVNSKQQEMKESNRRERVGFCTALGLGLNLFDNLQGLVSKRDGEGDFDSLTPDELDGMLAMWPEDDLDPDSKRPRLEYKTHTY
jgi:hypothetical protein